MPQDLLYVSLGIGGDSNRLQMVFERFPAFSAVLRESRQLQDQ
jgi:hypothetical protein